MGKKSNIYASELEKDIANCVIYGNPDAVKALKPETLNWFTVLQLFQEYKGQTIEGEEVPDCSLKAEQIALESYDKVLKIAEEQHLFWLNQ